MSIPPPRAPTGHLPGSAGPFDDLVGEPVDRVFAAERIQRRFQGRQAVGEHVHIDDLVDIGYPLRLGDRRRIDGMACRPRPLAIDVDPEIGGKCRVIFAWFGPYIVVAP